MDIKELLFIHALVQMAVHDNANKRASELDDESESDCQIPVNRPVRKYTPRPNYSNAGERLLVGVVLFLFIVALVVFFVGCMIS
ncbi:MAG: hypothetical protein E7042_00655 [Lentisphaerae bacterium]|nr:hypothetical protein [Lentisphaerota bacterium]